MQPVVIYDADCRFCETARRWIERWDHHQLLRFIHFEEAEACALQPDLIDVGCLDAFRLIDEDGRLWEGEEAAIQVARRLPGGRLLAWLLSLPGCYQVAGKAYQWIARHRYQLFGRVIRRGEH